MNPLPCRRLLQHLENDPLSPTTAADSSSAAAFKRQLDSSIALTIVVLVTAFFFIGMLSFYIRRSSAAEAAASRAEQEEKAAAVNSLPVVAYAKQVHVMEECPICLSEFEEGEDVKLIPYCGHVFHTGCVDTWLELHVTCPLCRSDQLFKIVDKEDV